MRKLEHFNKLMPYHFHSLMLRRTFTSCQIFSLTILLLTILFYQSVSASNDYLLPPEIIDFKHITLDDGLANPVVYDITKDRHGYLWFATGNGISRYDGYEFRNYISEVNNPHTIGVGPVIQLHVDSKARLWALVVGSGAYRYDEKLDSFISLNILLPGQHTLSSNNVYSIAEDKDGVFWISTTDKGLNRIDENNGTITHVRYQSGNPESIPTDRITAIYIDSKNDLWFSSVDQGIVKYDLESKSYEIMVPKIPSSIEMFEDSLGDLWIPSLGKGVLRYIRSENRFEYFDNDVKDGNSLSHNQVIKVTEDSYGTIWLTTWGGGINVFDRAKNSFRRHQNSPGRSNSINDNNAWGIFAEDTGVLWVGTYGSGVNKYDRKTERFPLLRHNPNDSNSLKSNNVKSLFQDSRGEIWFGTIGGGLSRYNPGSGLFSHYVHDPDKPDSISNNNVWGIAEDKSGDLWIATEHGLNRFNHTTETFQHYLHDPADPNSPGSNLIRSIMVDSKNNVWFGTQLVGVNRYNITDDRFSLYTVEGTHNIALFEDNEGNIWSGNIQALSRYDYQSDVFRTITIKKGDNASGNMGFFVSIKESSEKKIWIATTHGLEVISKEGQHLMSYGMKDGLNDEVISDFQFDTDGRLWVSTTRGLSVYKDEDRSFKNYELGSFNRSASLLAHDGTLYFGGTYGVRHFTPDSIEDNRIPPPIVITDFTIVNKHQKTDVPLVALNEVSLTHQDRFFTFEFAALDYSDPAKNRYRYRLLGFDRDWIEVNSQRRFATYTNLDAGDYVFQVTGSNNDDVWNPDPVSIKITVAPAWWETWWFYSFGMFVVIGVFGFIYQSKVKQLKSKLIASQRLRESEEKFRLVFENSPMGIVYFDALGKITACNDLFCIIMDRPKDQTVSCYLKELTSKQMEAAVHQTLQGEITHFSNNELSTDGGRQSVAIRAMFGPVYSSDGSIAGGIGVLEDISAQVKAEKDASLLEAKLQQAMKMEAIGTLAGGIAHDFNNILSVILGYSDIAKLSVKKNQADRIEDNLEKITQAGHRAKELVQQILSFSRQNDTERVHLNPASLLNETIKMLRSTLPTTIAIETDIEKVDKTILVNQVQMHQVVMNLCTNAYHAMGETRGKLTVSLKQVELNEEHLVKEHNVKPGTFFRLIITDTGTGIPEQIKHRIFDPYFTTKDVGKGTGMGLAIVHGIIQSYGGFISLYSQVGQGTSFHIFLPAESRDNVVKEIAKKSIPTGSGTILLVDDEEMIVSMGKEMLEQLGYTVTGYTRSTKAYEAFKDTPQKFDLVLTDQTMPEMTGEELARKVLAIREDIPIILCTGYSSTVTEEKARQAGIKAFALKPLVKEEIASLVQKIIA